jgi:hypothetical protein
MPRIVNIAIPAIRGIIMDIPNTRLPSIKNINKPNVIIKSIRTSFSFSSFAHI